MTHDLDGERVLTPRRRTDLLDRLVQVFLVHGFAAFSVDDLALRCHVSSSTLRAVAPDPSLLRRTVIHHYVTRSAAAADAEVAATTEPQCRPGAYLAAVAAQLAPASNAFFRDLERFPAGRQVYDAGARRSVERVRELLQDAVRAGRLRDVQASFVGDTVTAVTARISSGALLLSTGLDDARAYAELAALVTGGVSA